MPQLYLKEVQPFIVASNEKQALQPSSKKVSSIGEQKLYTRRTTKRSTSLIAFDALLLCLEFFQVLAVLQAMSLKWFWPEWWISNINFIFFFNIDVWEYVKVACGAFVGVREYDTPSATVSTEFYYILAGWAGFFALVFLIWAGIKIVLYKRQPGYLLIYNARLQRAIVVITQIIALPFGVSAFKVFHCTSDGKMSVKNTVECWSGLHWAYVVPVVIATVIIFVAFTAWLVWRIRHEALGSADQHHEDFLKLKEVEYMSGLDVVWAVRGLHLFSSFRLRAIYYRPVVHLVKLLILILYAATFQNTSAQAISMIVVLFLVALAVLAVRPFRLTVFNVAMATGYFCLTGDAVFGAVITQFKPTEVESPWLVEPYSTWILGALNGVLLLGTCIIFLVYLLAYRICCQGRCILEPLWPVMTAYEYDVEGVETQKYLAAVLRGRALIERCRRLPVMFTPVHEMAHQIRVLNAYMRESELMHDGLHPTLWAVLDEMIDMHHRLEHKSLFGEMVHESIRKNAAHFMTLMPMFAQRLAQRDYDLILVPPHKKRLLLKMYLVALFWDGSRQRKTHQELTQKVLTRIWEESAEIVEVTDEREYHEDLYPDAIHGPDTEALYSTGTLDLGRGLYDLEAAEEEEESLLSFLKRAPPQLALKEEDSRPDSSESPHNQPGEVTGTDNPAFTSDENICDRERHSLQDQTLTTTEIADTSEAPPDMLVDLETFPGTDCQTEGETAVELAGYEPGESSTDVAGYEPGENSTVAAVQDPNGQEEEGRTEDTTSESSRRNTGSSQTSTTSKSTTSSKHSSQDSDSKPSSDSAASSAGKRTAAGRSAKPSAPKAAGAKSAKRTRGKLGPKKK